MNTMRIHVYETKQLWGSACTNYYRKWVYYKWNELRSKPKYKSQRVYDFIEKHYNLKI